MSGDRVPWWGEAALDRERWGEVVRPMLEKILRARDRDRLPHALLLIGPPGLGRELAAVEIAALLTCEGADQPWAQSNCADRLRVGLHPDVEAVQPSGKKNIIKIDRIRDIVTTIPGRPFEGRRRVWILDGVEVEHFQKEAANAFLKVLEEPPAHAFLILLASNPMAVLPTIRSRCQQLVLPGPVAIARDLFAEMAIPELASAQSSEDLESVVGDVKKALSAGLQGGSKELLQLPYALPAEVRPFAVVAAGAMEMAAETRAEEESEELVRLAADLLAVERRARALNLNARSQIVSCLMKWQGELG